MNTLSDLTNLDLLALVEKDIPLRRIAATKGGEYAGPCPFCGGTDRFRVWPCHPSGTARWKCMGHEEGRAGCGKGGDTVAYLVERGDLTPADAGRLRRGEPTLGIPQPEVPKARSLQPPKRQLPPSPEWQRAGRAFVSRTQEQLWADEDALAWLRGRGLTDQTIKAAGLGWNPGDLWQQPQDWGLPDGDRIRLPRGWVIPWEVGRNLWQVSIRRPKGAPKYWMVRGSKHALYNADALAPGKPAILTEGVFDALTIAQAAADVIAAVAAGSTTGARRLRWVAKLALCSLVLVSFDAEADKGDKAAAWWVETLHNAKRWRPYWGDANAMAQEGVDLHQWIVAGLGRASRNGPRPVLAAAQTDAASPSSPVTFEPVLESSSASAQPAWVGQRVKIEDLPAFEERWRLRTVGSEWRDGEPCPIVDLEEA